MTLLLLEDDDAIGVGLSYSLTNEGYEVTKVETVREALTCIEKMTYDLYILDLTLPDGNGYEVCKAIKQQGDFPVIFLTAFDDEVNVVMGLELGADDYITKPFRLKELLARIKSVLRRYSNQQADGVIRYKELAVWTNDAKVYKGDEEVVLTAMEYRLLLILLQNRGMILSRNNLLENLWDVSGDFVNDNTLTVYMKRLRDKIEDDTACPVYIKTVRGQGYLME